MYLESLTLTNYRKFRSTDNTIYFVKPKTISINTEEKNTKSVIAPSTTLIIGKNNSGKTTVVNALKMLYQNDQPSASDFNLSYLNELFLEYKKNYNINNPTSFDELETPSLEFTFSIKIDLNDEDLMTNLAPFISISEKDNGEPVSIKIFINISISESSVLKDKVKKVFEQCIAQGGDLDSESLFGKFYSLLSKDDSENKDEGDIFKITVLDHERRPTDKFILKKLINIKEIKANRHLKDDVLSNVFNKIIAFQFTHDIDSRNKLERSIVSINDNISKDVKTKSADISQVLGEIENTEKVDLNLSGNVTYDSIMKGLIKYNFMDGEYYIPEDQFGLGYINLLNIIGEIIHFVDSYEEKSYLSKINLLFIEEPEAFMHPQMQEFFIKRIDNAVVKALEIANSNSSEEKKLQCQIAITTHSSHIVNSKINSSNTFNNLNYLTTINRCTKVINLTDDSVIAKSDKNKTQTLNFIKKHIKYKVSELFFSDAIIFVEGVTEETLLNYYIENHPELSNYYISVFNINGAHGKLYLPLARKLSVPCLIITDLDIKREKCEKNENHNQNESCHICGQKDKDGDKPHQPGSTPTYAQITQLIGRETTNATLIKFNEEIKGKSKEEARRLDNIDFFEDKNIYVVFQSKPIEGQYATSLEEAIILTNYKNNIINEVIEECKRDIYTSIVNSNGNNDRRNLINKSYMLQSKLSDSKSSFSNKLLFKVLSEEVPNNIPELPDYIKCGLDWIVRHLKKEIASTYIVNDTDIKISTETTQLQEVEAATNDFE